MFSSAKGKCLYLMEQFFLCSTFHKRSSGKLIRERATANLDRALRELRYIYIYYMEESVLLGTKPLVDSIRHFIRDPSGVFFVCHLWEWRIVQ